SQFQRRGPAIWFTLRPARHGRYHRSDAHGIRTHGSLGRLPRPRTDAQNRRGTGAAAVTNPKRTKGNGGDDDAYVLDDTGDSTVEDIEHEMEVTAQEAADSTATRRAKAAEESPAPENRELQNRYLRTLADFENYRKRADREKADFYK